LIKNKEKIRSRQDIVCLPLFNIIQKGGQSKMKKQGVYKKIFDEAKTKQLRVHTSAKSLYQGLLYLRKTGQIDSHIKFKITDYTFYCVVEKYQPIIIPDSDNVFVV
jgi:hypothetical protein